MLWTSETWQCGVRVECAQGNRAHANGSNHFSSSQSVVLFYTKFYFRIKLLHSYAIQPKTRIQTNYIVSSHDWMWMNYTRHPVSYTHLDVYKRQGYKLQYITVDPKK